MNKPATNINRVYRVRGRLDTGVLEEAIKTLIARHESLRTTFGEVEGTPCQRVGPVRLQLTQVDLSHFAAVDRVAAARELSVAEAKYRFDRANDPMLRTLLIRLDAQDNVLALTLDHIALDGWSLAILLRKLETLYDSLSAGVRAVLPELPFQPVDLGAWEVGSFRGEASQRHLAYWKHQLAGATARPSFRGMVREQISANIGVSSDPLPSQEICPTGSDAWPGRNAPHCPPPSWRPSRSSSSRPRARRIFP